MQDESLFTAIAFSGRKSSRVLKTSSGADISEPYSRQTCGLHAENWAAITVIKKQEDI
jgi:hypothetical protein